MLKTESRLEERNRTEVSLDDIVQEPLVRTEYVALWKCLTCYVAHPLHVISRPVKKGDINGLEILVLRFGKAPEEQATR